MRGNYRRLQGEYTVHNETWVGFPIRYIETPCGDWFIVLKDLCDALNMDVRNATRAVEEEELVEITIRRFEQQTRSVNSTHSVYDYEKKYEMLAVSEYGAVSLTFASRSLPARTFRRWN